MFDIKILWNGQEIPSMLLFVRTIFRCLSYYFPTTDSPFHPHIVNLDKVRLIGGWENVLDNDNRLALCFGEERKLTFDISEAGPGMRVLSFYWSILTFTL